MNTKHTEPRWTVTIEESTRQAYLNDGKTGQSFDMGEVADYAEAEQLKAQHCFQTGQDPDEQI